MACTLMLGVMATTALGMRPWLMAATMSTPLLMASLMPLMFMPLVPTPRRPNVSLEHLGSNRRLLGMTVMGMMASHGLCPAPAPYGPRPNVMGDLLRRCCC